VMLWRGAPYVPTHRTVAQLMSAGGILVAASDPLTTLVTDTGACDAEDIDLPSIPEGDLIPVITIVQTSAPAGGVDLAADAQRLVCFINRGVNLPFPPTGRPARIKWSNLLTKIFQS
jgi:hypothetical protein